MENVFQIAVLRVCLATLAVLLAASALVGLRQVGRQLLRRLKPFALAALLPMAALLTDFAGEKNTNMPLRVIQPVASQAFSSCGAVTNADWLAHGAYEDWFYILPSNWWARAASGGWIGSLRVFSFGGFQAYGADGTWSGYPPPFPQKLSLAPLANWHLLTNHESLATSHESLFWHGVTGSNTLVMTWQDGLYARCATNLVSFQAELFNDGSVAYRYDGSVPLELPFDRDGDGLENSVDPEPDVAGPDAHGTNAEWYNTVCSNVLEAVATSCDPPVELTWLGGVNSNAYYFVDVVAERGPAPIYFTGDRTSRLGDPVAVARAGETNRVPLTPRSPCRSPLTTCTRRWLRTSRASRAYVGRWSSWYRARPHPTPWRQSRRILTVPSNGTWPHHQGGRCEERRHASPLPLAATCHSAAPPIVRAADARYPADTPTSGRPSLCRYSGAGVRAAMTPMANRRRRPTLVRRGILP